VAGADLVSKDCRADSDSDPKNSFAADPNTSSNSESWCNFEPSNPDSKSNGNTDAIANRDSSPNAVPNRNSRSSSTGVN
jgi:hypothetical protein